MPQGPRLSRTHRYVTSGGPHWPSGLPFSARRRRSPSVKRRRFGPRRPRSTRFSARMYSIASPCWRASQLAKRGQSRTEVAPTASRSPNPRRTAFEREPLTFRRRSARSSFGTIRGRAHAPAAVRSRGLGATIRRCSSEFGSGRSLRPNSNRRTECRGTTGRASPRTSSSPRRDLRRSTASPEERLSELG